MLACTRGASTAPTLNLAVSLDAVPHTVLGAHAEPVSRQSWRSSTERLSIRARRRRDRPAVCVRGLSRPGVDLQLLRPRPDLLRRGCARRARHRTRRAAGRRYQTSRRGRLRHALRARRYRARRKNVTHQGSPPAPPDDLLPPGSLTIASDAMGLGRTTPAIGLALPVVRAA